MVGKLDWAGSNDPHCYACKVENRAENEAEPGNRNILQVNQ